MRKAVSSRSLWTRLLQKSLKLPTPATTFWTRIREKKTRPLRQDEGTKSIQSNHQFSLDRSRQSNESHDKNVNSLSCRFGISLCPSFGQTWSPITTTRSSWLILICHQEQRRLSKYRLTPCITELFKTKTTLRKQDRYGQWTIRSHALLTLIVWRRDYCSWHPWMNNCPSVGAIAESVWLGHCLF